MFVASVTLSLLAVAAPQTPSADGQEPVLNEREQKSLGSKLRDYLEADNEYNFAEGIRNREKASKARQKAKDKFEKEWDKAEKKGNVLGSMADLRVLFHNCFAREKPKHSYNKMHSRTNERDEPFGVYVPKKYSIKEAWPTLLVLPGGQGGTWTKPTDYFKQTWEGTEPSKGCIVQMPVVPQGLELDPIPDYSRDGAEAEEGRRIGAVFGAFGFLMRNYTVDRARVFLDCGREACGFGVRLATLFPDRFAGVILRDPTEVDDIRLGNLHGMPILLLKTAANGAAVDALKKRLDEKDPGQVTVLDAKGDYPHLESADDIAAWYADKRRDMDPLKVVLEPNHDRFKKAYWVDIHVADSLLTTGPDEKPRMEVTADREANRITVDTVGVERFELLLNDDIVDLDKEFTIVINGKAVQEKRNRSFSLMVERLVSRGDWDFLFPVRYVTTVPKE